MQPQVTAIALAVFIAAASAACNSGDATQLAELSSSDAGGAAGLGVFAPAGARGPAGESDAGHGVTIQGSSAGEPLAAGADALDSIPAHLDAGPAPAADAGSVAAAQAAGPCRGCVRIGVYADPNFAADYALALGTTWNLERTLITWRARIFDYDGSVSLIAYADDNAGEEVTTAMSSFHAADGWQELWLDLSSVEGFGAQASDAGVEARGFPFDKSKIRRVGLAIRPDGPGTGPRRATLEIDAITFSDAPALNADFSSGQGGFALVDSGDAIVSEVPE